MGHCNSQKVRYAVISYDQAEWQRLKRENNFAQDFVRAGDQALRNFARI
jgi:hypothetical protein